MSAWLAVSVVFGAGVLIGVPTGWALACLTAGWLRVRRLRRD